MASSFTPNDAQQILLIARSAPIQSMDAAEVRNDLFNRYVAWANDQFNVPTAPPEATNRRPGGEGPTETDPVPSAAALAAAGILPIISAE
jgi:hypothetical protein